MSWVSGFLPGETDIHHVYVWNPATGGFADVTDGSYNVFCSGNAFLPDGRLFIPGGHISDDHGLKQTVTYNWPSNSWEPVPNMRAGRWYPTATTLANGSVSVVAGAEEDGSTNLYPEIWDGSGWRLLTGAPLAMPYYPWMHPAPDGRVFNSGPDPVTHYLNPSGGGEWTYGPRSSGNMRDYGGSIMYAPGKILIVGGGDPPTNTAETIDLNSGGSWQSTGSMQYRRRQMNSTVLPDGKVLVIGGTQGAGFNNEAQAVLAPELWDPQTGIWTTLASMDIPRLYHSTAVLLPDGRVLAAGGGRCGPCTEDHPDAQVFSPPYLFAPDGSPATRPEITDAPSSVSYGETFTIQTPDAASITRVTWVRLPATTHTFNQNQWINELTFASGTGALSITAPAVAYLAPPGHYMLFVLNAAGVPSIAKVVRLVGSASLPPPPGDPAAPSALTGFAPDSERVNLTWTDNSSSESGFRIERCTGSGCTNFVEIDTAAANATHYSDAGLNKLTTYTYRLRAHNLAGSSGYTSSIAVTTKSTGPTGVPIVSRLSGKCLDTGSLTAGTPAIINACDGGAEQKWDIPASGMTSTIKAYSLMCLDATGGQGNDGDLIIIWDCNNNSNQQWTFTAAGDLKGINGKCIEVGGTGTADGDNLYLATCNGSTRQKWDPSRTSTTNQSPVANFTPACTGLSCTFTDASTDDGTIAGRSWTFGDGGTSTQTSPSHTYAAGGTYTVQLTVTDDKGATGTISKTVTPTGAASNAVAISSRASGKCLAVQGASHTNATPVVLAACLNSSEQQWKVPATGTAGPITVYDAATCLDASGAQGNVGDPIIIWPCHGGPGIPGPNQTWTYTSAGAITGINGRCIAIIGSPSTNGSTLALATCADVAAQKFDVGGTTAPNTPPVAAFTPACTGLSCTFTDGSTDDGTIASRAWTFGDGGTSTQTSPSHTYAAGGTYTVQLTVTDDKGATGSKSQSITVTGASNVPPTADFTSSCTNLACTFTDRSSDTDGTLSAWSWAFGDGSNSTTRNPSHTYTVAGTYTVLLKVTDNLGGTNQNSRSVAVTSSSTIVLTASGRSDATKQYMTLDWTGAKGTKVDIYRNGALLVRTANDGHLVNIRTFVGPASYTYKVCETGSTVCSNEATVTFN